MAAGFGFLVMGTRAGILWRNKKHSLFRRRKKIQKWKKKLSEIGIKQRFNIKNNTINRINFLG